MSRIRTLVLGTLTATAMLLVAAAPASARVVERGTFLDQFADSVDDFCGVPGFTIDFVFTAEGRYLVRSQGRDGLQYFMESASSTFAVTNPTNGLTIVEQTRVVDKDLHVTDNGDGTLTIIVLNTGGSTLYGPDGKAIARNPGQVRFELVVDHGGTPTDPSDDVELSFEPIKGSTGRTDDYCAATIHALL